MIFLTVGAQMPFNRLIETVDQWQANNPHIDIFAQIGKTEYKPRFIKNWDTLLDPDSFIKRIKGSSLVISHAGMGTILTTLHYGKPIIIMPRKGSLKETRNDHQIYSAEKLNELGIVTIAMNEGELIKKLDDWQQIKSTRTISAYASNELLNNLQSYINSI